MIDVLKKIWNIFTWFLVSVVILLAVALVGIRVIGFQPFAVLSGSMEPQYHVGSLIYVKSVDYRQIEPGDVITYLLDEDTVSTHRVVGIVPDEEDPTVLRYRTKGDANENEDGTLVHYKNIIGCPVEFSIPKLGYVASYISSPPGMYVAMGCAALMILLVFLPDLLKDDGKKRGRFERLDD